MAFLANRAVNRVHLHSAFVTFAQGAGGLFFFVFLLHAGVPIPAALLTQAAVVVGRFVVRPTLLPLAKRFGVKRLLIAGSAVMALQYPLLAFVHGIGPALAALAAVSGLGEVLYWMSYNAYYAAIGDAEHRGHQVAAREALMALIGIVSPLAGASLLLTLGPLAAFSLVAVIQLAAVWPILRTPEVPVKAQAPGALAAARPAFLMMVADGWFDTCWLFVWQIALFVTLKQSFSAYGGAMALAGLVGAGGALVLGPHVDAGHGRRSAAIAYSAGVAILILRVASLSRPSLAIAANAASALFFPLLIPVLVTVTANLNKASPCNLRFSMVTEAGWDIGCFAACLVTATLFAIGAPIELGVFLALPAMLGQWALLRRFYPKRAAALA
ncbi:MAG TPA: MFS transporter [Phenylobacterium sp.]|uniref:MFS transporter n=1 Tax=Phenylobacterium sp. TaxID=1871053 RepID=UPI002C5ACEF0|nr:MFS transporter [Phenylobacterium sp.]HSV04682.1 MFS transporter [Phenylobacterium sp.]